MHDEKLQVETDMKPVSELTMEELRIEIAVRTTWLSIAGHGDKWFVMLNGGIVSKHPTIAEAESALLANVPDWPNDTGEALGLCEKIARDRGWIFQLRFGPHKNLIAEFRYPGSPRGIFHSYGKNIHLLAQTSARLALAALRGGAK
jgi:hypothetical protein